MCDTENARWKHGERQFSSIIYRINALFDGVSGGFVGAVAPTDEPFRTYALGVKVGIESLEDGRTNKLDIQRELENRLFAKFVNLRWPENAVERTEGTPTMLISPHLLNEKLYLYWRKEPAIDYCEHHGVFTIRCRAMVSEKWV